MNKVRRLKSQDSLNVGWAKERVATCPTKRYNRNNDRHKIFNTARTAQTETHNSSRLNVGHGANASFPNLRSAITKKQKCRLGKASASLLTLKTHGCVECRYGRRIICLTYVHAGKALACPTKYRYQQGITYIEIMIVVLILGIIAVVAMPNLASNDHRKLDIAAEEIVQAIRFARIEAMRSDISYGVFFSSSSDIVKVYRLLSEVATYDVYHPVDKKFYILNLNTDSATAGVDFQSSGLYFGGSGSNREYLSFNTNGNPIYTNLGTDYLLDSATITLGYAGQTRVISVGPMTGRVTVQ